MGNHYSKSKQNVEDALERLSSSISSIQVRVPKNPLRKRMKHRKVLILSLDAAGKTCLLYKLKTGQMVNSIPTIGYNHEEIKYKSTIFSFWDLGGQDRIRTLWDPYFYNIHGIVFMVDANDPERLAESKDLLKEIIAKTWATGQDQAVLLILANKQDLPEAMTTATIATGLEVNKLVQNRWILIPCSVVDGSGLDDALEWLHREIKLRFR